MVNVGKTYAVVRGNVLRDPQLVVRSASVNLEAKWDCGDEEEWRRGVAAIGEFRANFVGKRRAELRALRRRLNASGLRAPTRSFKKRTATGEPCDAYVASEAMTRS